jgi:hypothetical protein
MASIYTVRTGRKELTPYQSLQAWRAKQWSFNKTRIDMLNAATTGIFATNAQASRAIGDLAVKAAVSRMQAGVNKLV